MIAEEWRSVPGYEGRYEVSNLGEVRSYATGRLRVVVAPVAKNGYRYAFLTQDGKRVGRTVHQLVCLAFHGPRPDGMQVRHLDGNKLNNHLDNLLYGTPSENSYDTVRQGAHYEARRSACAAGHPYPPEPRRDRRGGRVCTVCNRLRNVAYEQRQRAARTSSLTEAQR